MLITRACKKQSLLSCAQCLKHWCSILRKLVHTYLLPDNEARSQLTYLYYLHISTTEEFSFCQATDHALVQETSLTILRLTWLGVGLTDINQTLTALHDPDLLDKPAHLHTFILVLNPNESIIYGRAAALYFNTFKEFVRKLLTKGLCACKQQF